MRNKPDIISCSQRSQTPAITVLLLSMIICADSETNSKCSDDVCDIAYAATGAGVAAGASSTGLVAAGSGSDVAGAAGVSRDHQKSDNGLSIKFEMTHQQSQSLLAPQEFLRPLQESQRQARQQGLPLRKRWPSA